MEDNSFAIGVLLLLFIIKNPIDLIFFWYDTIEYIFIYIRLLVNALSDILQTGVLASFFFVFIILCLLVSLVLLTFYAVKHHALAVCVTVIRYVVKSAHYIGHIRRIRVFVF